MDGLIIRKLAADLTRAAATVEPLARVVVAKTARDIEADAKLIATAKGVKDTGRLIDSITSDIDGLKADIGPTVDYGIWNEIGTSRMPARPYMGPAADRRSGPFEEAMAQLAEDGLRG